MQQQTEEAQLWQEYSKTRSVAIRNKLIELYLPLVKRLAGMRMRRLANNAVIDRDECESLGTLGLIRAIERFEPERGWKFVTYASRRITGAMLDGVRQSDWVPRSQREAQKRGEVVPAEMGSFGEYDPESNAGNAPAPDEAMIREENREKLWKEVVKKLPGTILPFIVLRRFLHGDSFTKIARALPGRLLPGEVESRCNEALEKLRASGIREIML